MNWDQIEGKWKQAKGYVRQEWGDLRDDHMEEIGGMKDRLVGKIQEVYGVTKEEAEKQVDKWEKSDSYKEMHAKLEDFKASFAEGASADASDASKKT